MSSVAISMPAVGRTALFGPSFDFVNTRREAFHVPGPGAQLSNSGVCEAGGCNRSRAAALRPDGFADAGAQPGRVARLLGIRPPRAGTDRGPEIRGRAAEADRRVARARALGAGRNPGHAATGPRAQAAGDRPR